MNLTNEFESIREWAKQKGIIGEGNPVTQTVKAMEEMGELASAVLKQDIPEVQDAIGDVVVVLTSIAAQNGLRIEDCINSAYSVIKNRRGKMINNNFVKNS